MENLIFNKVDLGDFTFQKWEENPTFIGTFSHIASPMEVEEGKYRAEGVYMNDLEGNQVNIGQSFKVLDFFLNLESHDIDLDKSPVFKVTRTGKATTKKGEVSLFSFEVAYRK